jgi:hypothetical protein
MFFSGSKSGATIKRLRAHAIPPVSKSKKITRHALTRKARKDSTVTRIIAGLEG